MKNEFKTRGLSSIAVVRANNHQKLKTAIYDLVRYGNLNFYDTARHLEPEYADEILKKVLKKPLKEKCEVASVVPLTDDPGYAIRRLKQIHPPAHIIVVGPRYEIYKELTSFVDMLPEVKIKYDNWNLIDDKAF